MSDLAYLSIDQAHELLRTRQVSVRALVQYYFARIKQYDDKLRTVLTLCEDRALDQADELDKKIAGGHELGRLEGIPYTAKDMLLTRGITTTAGSKMLEDFVPPFSATVIEKLDRAGAILLAKVNQDEFGHGTTTENSAYHPSYNPWDTTRVPGGSSGGSAVAVSADFGIFSIGTDTGGSIRQPASFCGVTGLKPSYGLVSRYGVVAMGSSLDTIGPLTRSARDASLVLEVIAGRDHMDSTTIELDDYNFSAQESELAGKKFGIIKQFVDGLDESNKAVFDEATGRLAQAGAVLSTIDLPKLDYGLPSYYIIAPSEISSNLSRYDGIRFGYSDAGVTDLQSTYLQSREAGFGPEVKRRIMVGTYELSAGYYEAYYKKAMQLRTLIVGEFSKAFEQVDFLLGPSAPTPAIPFNYKANDPISMYLLDVMTVSANLAGVPALSLPAGQLDDLPIGLQVIGRAGADGAVLGVGASWQGLTDWHTRRPAL